MSFADSSERIASGAPAIGQMAALVRAKDWAATPIGARDAWPPSLKYPRETSKTGVHCKIPAHDRIIQWRPWAKTRLKDRRRSSCGQVL